ncbi:sensor histidine kinase [Curvibacter lanceolatus]|uniref:sensor histidine kinase n=1 Tax=Curvibacter lanceolatus TaxID=86182 RepID=UPI000373A6EA|nr:histidine kinase [Curvibacter lanceolatus]
MARQKANDGRNGIEIKHSAAIPIYASQWLLVGMLLFGPLLAHAQQAIILDTASVNIQYKTQGHVQKTVALPYYWDFKEPGKSGIAVFDLGTVDNRDGQIDSIYIPRIGNHHAITLNGHDLDSDLIEEPVSGTHVSGPRLLRIPPMLQADSLNVRITLSAEQMTNAGLSRVTLGQAKELRSTYLLRKFWDIDSRWIATAISALLTLFSFGLWAQQREAGILYYCLSELCWTILSARMIVPDPPLNQALWQVLTFISPIFIGGAGLCLYLYSLQPSSQRSNFANGAYLMPMAAASIVLCSLTANRYLMGILLLPIAAALVHLAYLNARALAASQDKNSIHVLVTFTVVVVLVTIELFIFTLSKSAYEHINLLRLVWVFVGISFAKSMLDRVVHANLMLSTAARVLRQPLPHRPTELAEAFEASHRQHLIDGAAQERLRLIHDLHDGVGSQLSSTLDMAQQQGANSSDMVPHLRKTLEQLKLTVDALEESDGNLESIIASVRYRLAPRIDAMGVRLQWHVDPLPIFEHWSSQHALHLQMLLLEAFDNSIKYAKTHCIEFTATPLTEPDATGVTLTLKDAGPGFVWPPPESKQLSNRGKGMGIMFYRAEKIGAHLGIKSGPGGTTLTLQLIKKSTQAFK